MFIYGKITKFPSGVAFPNANVRVLGSNPERSAQSDSNGKYKVEAFPFETLRFTHAGTQDFYEKQLSAYDTIVDVALQDGYVMDEVVITDDQRDFNWWWLLLLPVAGFIGYNMYRKNDGKKNNTTKFSLKNQSNKKKPIQPKKVVFKNKTTPKKVTL